MKAYADSAIVAIPGRSDTLQIGVFEVAARRLDNPVGRIGLGLVAISMRFTGFDVLVSHGLSPW